MTAALVGGLLGVGAGSLSVGSLWLIVGVTGRMARELKPMPEIERVSKWDWEQETVESGPAPVPFRPARDGVSARSAGRFPRPRGEPSPKASTLHATLRLLIAFLLKAPLLILIALGARSLGSTGLHWCVGGVVLVYSLAVFWAAAQNTVRR